MSRRPWLLGGEGLTFRGKQAELHAELRAALIESSSYCLDAPQHRLLRGLSTGSGEPSSCPQTASSLQPGPQSSDSDRVTGSLLDTCDHKARLVAPQSQPSASQTSQEPLPTFL